MFSLGSRVPRAADSSTIGALNESRDTIQSRVTGLVEACHGSNGMRDSKPWWDRIRSSQLRAANTPLFSVFKATTVCVTRVSGV